jgi:hypothetical protein
MTKINFLITAVHYGDNPHVIESVMWKNYDDDRPPTVTSKMDVILRLIGDLVAWTLEADGQLGAPVRVVNTKSGSYLRTVPDDIEADNLGDLPHF